MTIDRQKLQKLLWAEAASYRADCAGWKRNTEALQEFLGEKTVEEVALELLAENGKLALKADSLEFAKWSCQVNEQAIRAAGHETIEDLAEERDKLKSENEALRLRCDHLDEDKAAMTETHALYTWLRKKCDQPSNDFVSVQMNIGHDWVPVHDLDRDLLSMIEREEP